jgi:hypothetical protein
VEQHTSPPPAKSYNWVYAFAAVGAFALIGGGAAQVANHQNGWTLIAAGALALIGVAVTWPLACLIGSASSATSIAEAEVQVRNRLDQMLKMMDKISSQQLLSDRARSVAFRDKDRDAIRQALNEELAQGEWEAAYALADQFEKAFGSKSEADRVRAEINAKRNVGMQQQIADVSAVIERHTKAEQWSAALREAEKLIAMLPDNAQARQLPRDIEAKRQAHKQRLMQSYHEAVARHDHDASIDQLKQLDPYLTPAEAESMQETVRGIFKEKLNNMGAQFGTLVRDKKWVEAVKLGEQIQAEFPNSRFAQEVKDKMPALRTRANEPAGAGA